jgi:hypothetical protein
LSTYDTTLDELVEKWLRIPASLRSRLGKLLEMHEAKPEPRASKRFFVFSISF